MSALRILVYGEDSLVVSTRAMILERAGYSVVFTTRAEELLPLLKGVAFDLLLVGDSVRTPQNVAIVEHLRAHLPALSIMMVQDVTDARDPWSTAFAPSTPEQMLKAIARLFEQPRKIPTSAPDPAARVRNAGRGQ